MEKFLDAWMMVARRRCDDRIATATAGRTARGPTIYAAALLGREAIPQKACTPVESL
jgi:hypothetical protein